LKDTGVAFGKEEGEAAARSSKDIVATTLEAVDKALTSEAAEVIGHLAVAVMGLAEVGGYQRAQGSVGEAVRQVAELAQAGKQCHDTGVAEAKSGSTLAVNEGRQHDLLQGVSANGTALTHPLGIQKTPVGLSADGKQVG
jgi:hypothetical protein